MEEPKLDKRKEETVELLNDMLNIVDDHNIDTILEVMALVVCLICDQFDIERDEFKEYMDNIQGLEGVTNVG